MFRRYGIGQFLLLTAAIAVTVAFRYTGPVIACLAPIMVLTGIEVWNDILANRTGIRECGMVGAVSGSAGSLLVFIVYLASGVIERVFGLEQNPDSGHVVFSAAAPLLLGLLAIMGSVAGVLTGMTVGFAASGVIVTQLPD